MEIVRRHYITDLKILIRLTVNWIHSTLLTEKYVTDLDPSDDST